MGLDTTAWGKVLRIDDHDCDTHTDEGSEDCYERGHREIFVYADFPHGLVGLEGPFTMRKSWGAELLSAGYYKLSDQGPTTHNSYSGHSQFRNCLLEIAEWPAVTDWRADEVKELPFYELLWFADNEGFLGPVACESLYHDFVEYRDRAAEWFAENGYYYVTGLYRDWLESFNHARGRGVVDFH